MTSWFRSVLCQLHFFVACPISASNPPQLQILSDFSYGWQLVHAMTPLMQEQVCNNYLEKKTHPNRWPGEDRSANGGTASYHLPEVGGSHGGGNGEAWRSWKQGALSCVSILLLYPGHLYQDCLAGGKSQVQHIVDFHLDQFHFDIKYKAGL